jgi:hypothetical protein
LYSTNIVRFSPFSEIGSVVVIGLKSVEGVPVRLRQTIGYSTYSEQGLSILYLNINHSTVLDRNSGNLLAVVKDENPTVDNRTVKTEMSINTS